MVAALRNRKPPRQARQGRHGRRRRQAEKPLQQAEQHRCPEACVDTTTLTGHSIALHTMQAEKHNISLARDHPQVT